MWFRISAVVLVLFAAGHTFGFQTFRPPTAEGLAVWNAMNHVRFTVNGTNLSYGQSFREEEQGTGCRGTGNGCGC